MQTESIVPATHFILFGAMGDLACLPVPADQVSAFAVRGQYAQGWIEGRHTVGYCDEPGIAFDSNVETYAAAERLVARDGRAWLTPSQWHPRSAGESAADDER